MTYPPKVPDPRIAALLLGMDVDPADATLEDARAAGDKLIQQREDEIVRSYYGNDYVQPLANGDLALTIAWSGDVLGKTLGANSKIEFVVPDTGAVAFFTTMHLARHSKNIDNAYKYLSDKFWTE